MRTLTRFTLAALAAAPIALGSFSLPAYTPYASAEAATVVSNPQATVHTDSAADFAQFLKVKLNIELPAQPTQGDFLLALAAVALDGKVTAVDGATPEFSDLKAGSALYDAAALLYNAGVLTDTEVKASDRLSTLDAALIAFKASGLKELAYTYPDAKVARTLSNAGISSSLVTDQAAQELAAAIDTGLVPASLYPALREGGTASRDYTNTLLGRILVSQGKYKHSIGRTNDADIYSKLYAAYRSTGLVEVPELRSILDQALLTDLVTGYNLKDSRFDSNFIDELTLTYGHDDIKHAVQLVGLLRSEGTDAAVQLQPKTSAFIYLKEWGEPKETPDYKVVQIENGNYIAYAKEYDIQFEFKNTTDKARFDQVVAQYAKKNSDSTANLIYGSWWQPLYYTNTALNGYPVIANNKISLGNYYGQSFSLKEQTGAIADGLRKLAPDATVTSYTFWVDQPFFNYLNGESE
ncbi:hypothetical protein D3C74_25110 [compost metagenome]